MTADLKPDFLAFLTRTIARLRWEESSPLPISRVSIALIAKPIFVADDLLKASPIVLENRFISVR